MKVYFALLLLMLVLYGCLNSSGSTKASGDVGLVNNGGGEAANAGENTANKGGAAGSLESSSGSSGSSSSSSTPSSGQNTANEGGTTGSSGSYSGSSSSPSSNPSSSSSEEFDVNKEDWYSLMVNRESIYCQYNYTFQGGYVQTIEMYIKGYGNELKYKTVSLDPMGGRYIFVSTIKKEGNSYRVYGKSYDGNKCSNFSFMLNNNMNAGFGFGDAFYETIRGSGGGYSISGSDSSGEHYSFFCVRKPLDDSIFSIGECS